MAPMSRYLTPQKISLLVLVKLYCTSQLPSSCTIPVLSFILTHSQTLPPVLSVARAQPSHDSSYYVSFPISAFEEVLQGHAFSMPGRTLLDVFLEHMWKLNSFDALHSLFDSIGGLLAGGDEDGEHDANPDRIILSRTSPLGSFVRRARLEFTRLQFVSALKLWTSFIQYRAPTAQWTRRIAGLAAIGVDAVAADIGLQQGDALYEVAYGHLAEEEDTDQSLSVDDFDRLLDFQLDQLQRLGCRVPEEMRTQLRDMLGPSGVVLRQSHLVQFFDAWKAGDYTSAFDNLHRYYDYAMQTRDKIHYQYALLHMAILQADFGCFGEAVAAINDTISTARENQDMVCLNFALSWLNHMSKAYPKQMKGVGYMGMLGTERDGLTFLKTKAREAKMWNLLSATLLNEAKLCLSTGDSVTRAFEFMYQASHLNIRENINNNGSVMLLTSTIYSRLGITHLSDAYCHLLLLVYNDTSPIDERIRATCRLAFNEVQTGQYDKGLARIESIDQSAHGVLKFRQYIFFSTGLIKLKRAIRHTDWSACESYLTSLKPDIATDPELSFLLQSTHIEYLIARSLFSEAFNTIEDLSTSLKEEGADILHRVTLLLLKADMFRKLGTPERGFSVALRAASVAYKSKLIPQLWIALGLLCNILNGLGEFGEAMRLLEAIVPQSMLVEDNHLTGILYSHLSDSLIGLAGQDDISTSHGTRARSTHLSNAEMYIDRARDCFKKVEDIEGECEQLVKRAIVAKLRGDEQLSEEWAQNHNKVWEEGRARIEGGK
ncbi:hypothetical protein P154DRAFT_491575 [Amniculicola lignicola CBS 123094]|uniref:Anaphase-promoting complex subunit 5 n=1 Tax=Amniculicola lignicola CBS 123094 TaxID=1392246 RepID=A0A6A5WIN4_9PLEO|nr:hypothetical protein P154DRAFT_491575 [Amniculicola lignicola CBS 123094]